MCNAQTFRQRQASASPGGDQFMIAGKNQSKIKLLQGIEDEIINYAGRQPLQAHKKYHEAVPRRFSCRKEQSQFL